MKLPITFPKSYNIYIWGFFIEGIFMIWNAIFYIDLQIDLFQGND